MRSTTLLSAITGLGILASVTAAVVATSPSANAASASTADCPYPYVCLYKVGEEGLQRSGQFRQVTAGWQYLTVSRKAQVLVNTRHDDVVYVEHLDGLVGCFPPDNIANEMSPIVAIRISSASECHL